MTGFEWAVLAALIGVLWTVHEVKFPAKPSPEWSPWFKEVVT